MANPNVDYDEFQKALVAEAEEMGAMMVRNPEREGAIDPIAAYVTRFSGRLHQDARREYARRSAHEFLCLQINTMKLNKRERDSWVNRLLRFRTNLFADLDREREVDGHKSIITQRLEEIERQRRESLQGVS